ncbi:fibronectin type III domain protein [Clostridium sp. CAG:780]|nr:fibronectin type III domain protein [Clostridium sp. CAG:780]
MLRNKKGITLIALVVTIVVLLILAGVTLNLLLDENGIISKSKDARNKWAEAQEKEQKEMDDFVKENFPNWDGKQTEMPEIKKNETTSKFDWYIYNESQMKFLANYVNNTLTEQDQKMITDNNTTVDDIAITEETTIYLMNDLNLGATFDSSGNLISGEQWIPIGATKDKTMLGTFEGNNHYICGVYINRNEKFNGIFGNCNSIKNLTIKNSYIEGLNCTGGIAGVVRKGTVENCHNNNTTVVLKKGDNMTVGGIVAQCTGEKIEKCTNTGKIISYATATTGFAQIAGIAGVSVNTDYIECINYGDISIEVEETEFSKLENWPAYVGGICGADNINIEGKGIIRDCHNEGKIKGVYSVGGIVGSSYIGANIQNCSNIGNVEGYCFIGGIVGQFGNTENKLSYSNLSECYNSGDIIAKDLSDMEAGGIIGTIRNRGREDVITKCYSKGNIINAKEKCGAIIGYDENTEPKAKLSELYYLNSVGVGAMNNSDDETRKLQAVEDDVKTYEEFLEWIKTK